MRLLYTMFLCIALLVSLSVWCSAQVNFGGSVSTEYGIGPILQLGPPAIKLEVGGGVTPLFVFWSITRIDLYGSRYDNKFEVYLPLSAGAKIDLALFDTPEGRLGFKAGVTYNSLIKLGFGAGVDYAIKGEKLVVISGGLMFYPDAKSELIKRFNKDEGTNFTEDDITAPLMGFQPFVGVALLF